MKTYTITTYAGREIAKNVGPDKLFEAIPAGFTIAGASKKFKQPHQLFKKKVGPSQFETIIVMEDQAQ